MANLIELSSAPVGTINLAGSTVDAPYVIVSAGHAPAGQRRRRSRLGNQSRFEDVTETIVLNIYGATEAACLANLDTLARQLEQAEDWSAEESTSPVILTVAPDGGTRKLSAIVLGYSGADDASPWDLPVEFLDDLGQYTIQELTLRIRHTGPWLFAAYPTPQLLQGTGFDRNWALSGWTTFLAGGNAGTVYTVPGAGKGANGGTVVTYDSSVVASAADGNNRQLRSPKFAVSVGQVWTFSLEYVGVGYIAAYLYSDTVGAFVSDVANIDPPGGGTFPTARVSANLTVSGNASDAYLVIALYIGGSGQIFFMAEPFLGNWTDTKWHRADADETTAVVSATAAAGTVQAAEFLTDCKLPAPCEAQVNLGSTGAAGATLESAGAGMLVYSHDATRIQAIEAEALNTGAGGLSVVAEAGNLASGGNVLRYTASGLDAVQSQWVASTIPATVKRVAAIATLRVNTPGTSFSVRLRDAKLGGPIGEARLVAYSNGQPQVIYLDPIASARTLGPFGLQIQAHQASGTLDIDRLIVFAVDQATEGAIGHDALDLGAALGYGHQVALAAQDRSLTASEPQLAMLKKSTGESIPVGWRGDALIHTVGTTLVVCWLATSGQYWTPVYVNLTQVQINLQAFRKPAFLAPR